MRLHNSLDTLKILTFWNIIKENNIFLIDKDYIEGKTYTKAEAEKVDAKWNELYDEYYELSNDVLIKSDLDKRFKYLKLSSKIKELRNNYEYLIKVYTNIKHIGMINAVKFENEAYKRIKLIEKRIRFTDDIQANLKAVERVILALTNQLNQIDLKEASKKGINNVYEVVANAESWIGRNLDIENMVVSHWLAIQKQVKQKQNAQKK